jgi:hypothetical protein
MNKLSVLALATAFAISGPMAAHAQDAQVDTGVDAGVEVGVDAGGDAGADAGAGAGVGVDAEVGAEGGLDVEGTDVEGMGGTAAADASIDLEALETASNVTIVVVGEEGAIAEDDPLIEAQAETLADIQAAIELNPNIVEQLEAQGLTSADVVAVEAAAEGEFTVYVSAAE